MYQQTIIIGRIGQITPAATSDSTSVSNFTVCTTKNVKQKDGTFKEYDNWHRLVAYGHIADHFNLKMAPGDLIHLDNLELRTREYEVNGEKRYITELICDSFPKKLPRYYSKGDSSGQQHPAQNAPAPQQQNRTNNSAPQRSNRAPANNGYGNNVPV